jgi:hypothetical protein
LNEVPASETLAEAPEQRFGRKLYLVIALVAIAIILVASILFFTQFMPSAKGEAVSLGFTYNVGEQMTYEISMTVEAMGEEMSAEGTLVTEVQSFDGENYTIHQAITVDSKEYSVTVKMDQMGNIVDYTDDLPPETEEIISSLLGAPGFGSYFPKDEVRVGESWELPVDMEIMGIDLEGTFSYKLSETTSVTVPAGTYKALDIEIKQSHFDATYSVEGKSFEMSLDIDGYMFLENATCRLIEFKAEESMTMTGMGETMTMEVTMQIQLTEHIK